MALSKHDDELPNNTQPRNDYMTGDPTNEETESYMRQRHPNAGLSKLSVLVDVKPTAPPMTIYFDNPSWVVGKIRRMRLIAQRALFRMKRWRTQRK